MKIPLIMRKQYQGQLSASMLCYYFMQNRFYDRFFFVRRLFLNPKNKKHRNLLRCRFQNGELTRAIANIKLPMYAMIFDAIFTFC